MQAEVLEKLVSKITQGMMVVQAEILEKLESKLTQGMVVQAEVLEKLESKLTQGMLVVQADVLEKLETKLTQGMVVQAEFLEKLESKYGSRKVSVDESTKNEERTLAAEEKDEAAIAQPETYEQGKARRAAELRAYA